MTCVFTLVEKFGDESRGSGRQLSDRAPMFDQPWLTDVVWVIVFLETVWSAQSGDTWRLGSFVSYGLSHPRIPDWHLSQPWYFVQFWEELEMDHSEVFTINEKATRAFSLLKSATTTFTFKNLLRHYAKQVLTGCK